MADIKIHIIVHKWIQNAIVKNLFDQFFKDYKGINTSQLENVQYVKWIFVLRFAKNYI